MSAHVHDVTGEDVSSIFEHFTQVQRPVYTFSPDIASHFKPVAHVGRPVPVPAADAPFTASDGSSFFSPCKRTPRTLPPDIARLFKPCIKKKQFRVPADVVYPDPSISVEECHTLLSHAQTVVNGVRDTDQRITPLARKKVSSLSPAVPPPSPLYKPVDLSHLGYSEDLDPDIDTYSLATRASTDSDYEADQLEWVDIKGYISRQRERYKFRIPVGTKKRVFKDTNRKRKGKRVSKSVARTLNVKSFSLSYASVSGCCLNKFEQFRVPHCKSSFVQTRGDFAIKSSTVRGQFVLDSLYKMDSCPDGRYHTWNDVSMCSNCFCHTYGIPRRFYQKCEDAYLKNHTTFVEYRGSTKPAPKRNMITAWLEEYISEVGDYSPEDELVYLPFCKQSAMYHEFVTDSKLSCSASTVPDRTYFTKILNSEEFKHVKISDYKPLSTCTHCFTLRTRLLLANTQGERIALKAERKKHMDEVRRERANYYLRKLEAAKYPERVLSMITDIMDQSKTNVPKPSSSVMGDDNIPILKTTVLAVKVHGKTAGNYVYLSHADIPHGANICVQAIYETLMNIGLDNLPPVLYLQLDNTVKENKNYTVLGFLAWLIEMGIFREVFVHYLPKGHTHEDIDQFFGVLSRFIRCMSIGSVERLKQAIEDCCSPAPIVSIMESCGNFVSFIRPFVNATSTTTTCPPELKLTGIDLPHAFMLVWSEDTKKCLLRYKQWSRHECWLPTEGMEVLNGVPVMKPYLISKRKIDFRSIRAGV
jgi:hypothetical protein